MITRVLATMAVALLLGAPAHAGEGDAHASPEAAETQGEEGMDAGGAEASTAGSTLIAEQRPDHVLGGDMLGVRVTNREGEAIGHIDDVILDRDARVVGAVVGVGGFLGIGAKPVGVPFDELQFQPDGDAMVQMSRQELEDAPAFRTLSEQEAETQSEPMEQDTPEQNPQGVED